MNSCLLNLASDGLLRFRSSSDRFAIRELMLGDEPLFESEAGCDTCGRLFAAAATLDAPLGPAELRTTLTGDLSDVSDDLIRAVVPLLPKGKYLVGLLRACPTLQHIRPFGDRRARFRGAGSAIDYQWLCRSRSREVRIGLDRAPGGESMEVIGRHEEAEVILPHRAFQTLDPRRVDDFLARPTPTPTALVLSILERRFPHGTSIADRLTHFLLDGHHKTRAASSSGRPIQILSFLNLSASDTMLTDRTLRRVGEYVTRRRASPLRRATAR